MPFRRFFLFLWHMITDSHKYAFSNSHEGSMRCKTCRYLKHPSVFDSLTDA